MKKTPPLLLLLLGLLAGYPVARIATAPAEKTEPPKEGSVLAGAQAALQSEDCKPRGEQDKKTPPHSWCMPVQVLREFLGLPADLEKTRGESLAELIATAKASDYHDLRFMVALVPAPPDPRLDQALDAIQRGFANAKDNDPSAPEVFPPRPDDYLIDRIWLPWAGAETAKGTISQQAPGIMLFRGSKPRSIGLVFLVLETSKRGIQKDALRAALDLIADLQGVTLESRVSILGPSFSGSVESLRLALLSWRQSGGDRLQFQAASGSATASGLEEIFRDEMNVPFCRTVLPDDWLHDRALGFLSRQMGWDPGKIVLLTEDDTSYGQSLLKAGEKSHGRTVLITFPSHISDLRNAWEVEQKAQKQVALETPLQTERRVLDMDLAGREQVGDLVPTFSPLTTLSSDMVLSNLLETIAREGARYVGIVATDVKDKLFLAEKIRKFSPDVVLFTLDNNLLYAHPKYAQTMDGMLVFSSSPLFTEGAPWLPASRKDGQGGQRRQFSGEYQQGVFEAVRYLLGATPVPAQAWISAVGNGSLWPIAGLTVPQAFGKETGLCGADKEAGGAPPGKVSTERGGNGFAGKDDLQILLVAVILGLLAIGLNRKALLEEIQGAKLDYVPGNRRLLTLGAVLLAAAAGFLLAVGSIPLWSRIFLPAPPVAWEPAQWAYLLALAGAYALLVRNAARAAHGDSMSLIAAIAWALGGLLGFALLALGVWRFCVPGDQIQFFHLRARALSSGLSPLVSLAVVGGAIYSWIWSELVRRRLMARLATDCPLEALCDPATAGSMPILESFRDLLTRTLPAGYGPWALMLIAFVPPVSLLWWTVQPIGETRGYGRFFVVFLAVAFALSALSFYRFVRLWRGTLRILHRLDDASPAVAKAFEEISEELDWRPIKSFGWQIPPFRTLVLSVYKLRALVEANKVVVEGYPDSLDIPLKAMFEHERNGGSAREIENRNAIGALFAQACLELRSQIADPEVRRFLALRVAAYLRYVFAHMRNSLIGGLACGLLALVGVTAYVFEPKHFISLAGWLGLGIAVTLTIWIFLQMDRNPTLSRIGNTTPGQVTFDRVFLTKLLTYAGIPILGLIATQFPQVGRMLGTLTSQLLRIGGGG
jgi:hypothetical protein